MLSPHTSSVILSERSESKDQAQDPSTRSLRSLARDDKEGDQPVDSRQEIAGMTEKYLAGMTEKDLAGMTTWVCHSDKRGQTQSLKESIIWFVEVAARYLPFGANCLTKAIVTQLFFRRAHYPATLRIGVAKNGKKTLDAHAWVESEGQIVTGNWDPGLQYQILNIPTLL